MKASSFANLSMLPSFSELRFDWVYLISGRIASSDSESSWSVRSSIDLLTHSMVLSKYKSPNILEPTSKLCSFFDSSNWFLTILSAWSCAASFYRKICNFLVKVPLDLSLSKQIRSQMNFISAMARWTAEILSGLTVLFSSLLNISTLFIIDLSWSRIEFIEAFISESSVDTAFKSKSSSYLRLCSCVSHSFMRRANWEICSFMRSTFSCSMSLNILSILLVSNWC